jgi:hypothetical protein
MRLYKREQTWWADFSVNGQRFRLSLDTTDKRKAPGIANEKVALAQRGQLSTASQSFSRLAFGEAADRYIASRAI